MTQSPDFRRVKTTSQMISESRKPKKLPETGWYKVGITAGYEGNDPVQDAQLNGSTVFLSTWANVAGATNPHASWYLSDDGEVRMRGKITGGTAGSTICVLPEECRPEYAETFIVAVDGGGKANVTIFPSGNVYVDSITS